MIKHLHSRISLAEYSVTAFKGNFEILELHCKECKQIDPSDDPGWSGYFHNRRTHEF